MLKLGCESKPEPTRMISKFEGGNHSVPSFFLWECSTLVIGWPASFGGGGGDDPWR